jgi:sarcosine oxidase
VADADVIVIGLGAAGGAVTYQLARHGVDVIGIDRFRLPHGRGSSHGETRISRLTDEGAHYAPLAMRSRELWQEIEAASGVEIFTATGYLSIADARQAPDAFVIQQQSAQVVGAEHQLLDSIDIRRRFPQFDVTSSHIGFYEPGSGIIRPEAAVTQQLSLAERFGAKIRQGEQVTAIAATPSGVMVHTDRGRFTADRVVMAAGPWVADLINDARLASLFVVYRQVLHWFTFDGPTQAFRPGRFPVFTWRPGARPRPRFYGFSDLGWTNAEDICRPI